MSVIIDTDPNLARPVSDAQIRRLWEIDCLHWRGRVLTGKKAHYCFEWDELTVDETTEEIACCHDLPPDYISPFHTGDEAGKDGGK